MPDSNNKISLPGVIGAGASIIGDVVGAITQGAQNRKQKQFAIDMYNRQRQDALADWNMQNAYNSPEQQMARLKSAGLNPNLVYGTGTVGNNAAPIKSGSQGNYNPHTPQWANVPTGAVGTYFDAQIKEAQIDNMAKQRQVMDSTIARNNMEVAAKGAATSMTRFQLDMAQALKDTTIAQQQANLARTYQGMDIANDQNVRNWIQTDQNLQVTATRIGLMLSAQAKNEAESARIMQVIENLKKAGTLQDMEISLRRNGVSWSDPLWARQLAQIFNAAGVDIGKNVGQWLKDFFTPKGKPSPSSDYPNNSPRSIIGNPFFGYPKY